MLLAHLQPLLRYIRNAIHTELHRASIVYLSIILESKDIYWVLSWTNTIPRWRQRSPFLSTAEQVEHAVQKYIRFYNHERFQVKLNNLSPYEYRTQVA
ncbi:IS3 family transposase [Paenibacillus mangrovi]|uniref:IS3 family transposase n=1 Tax=Paenibacillus mangrovi TaxID=2931978 RepID=UPI002467C925|nr:IS3 family transposase [Paenibacillus mangrovi]